MIGFLVQGRVRIKIRIRIRVRVWVGVMFNISIYHRSNCHRSKCWTFLNRHIQTFGPTKCNNTSVGVSLWPCIQTGSRLPGTVWRGLIFFTTDRPDYHRMPPACRGQSRLSGFCCAHRLCVRSPCQHISRMRTFDNNSCAISITSPRSIFVPGTQHVWWGCREKSRRASTRCDCRGKSRLAGLSPLSGTPSERGVRPLFGFISQVD